MRTCMVSDGILLAAAVSLTLAPALAQVTADSKYPLRLHVLAVDDTHKTVRLQPNWCSGSVPVVGGDTGGAGGVEGSPCGGGGSTSFGGDDDFAGGGRADLVTPRSGTQALNFTYEGCNRMRVPTGFHGLPARWKATGKLEVLIPSDRIDVGSGAEPVQRCTLKATTHEFVYLRLANGSMVKVSQEAYQRKPALRVFLSGGSETLQRRVPPTFSAQELIKKD